MDIQQVAPWASLAASLLTFAYVGVQEWRRAPGEDDSAHSRGRPSLGEVVASADIFLFVTVTMLFLAALTHYVLSLVSATFLVVPVWLLALFVVVSTGLVQTMPGETFEAKVERLTERLGAEVDVATPEAARDSADSPPDSASRGHSERARVETDERAEK